MTPNEYWYGDCSLCKAYLAKVKIERKRSDFEQWKLGLYVFDAVSVAIARGINGDSKAHYPEHPYESEENAKEQIMKEAAAQFEAFAILHNNAKKRAENG